MAAAECRFSCYNFKSSHQVKGALFYGNSTNICCIIDCSKLRTRSLNKVVVDFTFSEVEGLQFLALLGNDLFCACG